MKLFAIKNLASTTPYNAWVHRKDGRYAAGYLAMTPEIIVTSPQRLIKVRNFVSAVSNATQSWNERTKDDKARAVDLDKFAVVEIDLSNIEKPFIKLHTMKEAAELR